MSKIKTLKEYQKKYKHCKQKLLTYTKADVERFQKTVTDKTIQSNYLLKGKKWVLIGDTYYQIPRFPSFTWFRNLNAGIRAATYLTLGAIVGTTGYVSINYCYRAFWKQSVDNVNIQEKYNDYISFQAKRNEKREGVITLIEKDSKKCVLVDVETVKLGNKNLTKGKDYNFDLESKQIIIKPDIMTDNDGVKIEISPKVKAALTGITVKQGSAHKTVFESGNKFSSKNLVVVASYYDGSSVDLTEGFTCSLNETTFTSEDIGNVKNKITYKEYSNTVSCEYNVEIKPAHATRLIITDSKDNYYVNEKFTVEGLSLQINNSDGTETYLTLSDTSLPDGVSLEVSGIENPIGHVFTDEDRQSTHTVTIKYHNPKSIIQDDVSDSFDLTLKAVEFRSLEVVKGSSFVDKYAEGDTVNTEGLSLKITYSPGTDDEAISSTQMTADLYDSEIKPGTVLAFENCGNQTLTGKVTRCETTKDFSYNVFVDPTHLEFTISLEEGRNLSNSATHSFIATRNDSKIVTKLLKWEITEGGDIASINADGVLTPVTNKEGPVTVKAKYASDPTYEKTYEVWIGSFDKIDIDTTDNLVKAKNTTIAGDVVVPTKYYNGDILTEVAGLKISAFKNCNSLSSISLPSSITEIPKDAFNCDTEGSLSSIAMASDATLIGDNAFKNQASLSSVTLASTFTTIGVDAFNGCSSLTEITIPSSTTSIGARAFKNSGLIKANMDVNRVWKVVKNPEVITFGPTNNTSLNAQALTTTYCDYQLKYFDLSKEPFSFTVLSEEDNTAAIGRNTSISCPTEVVIPDHIDLETESNGIKRYTVTKILTGFASSNIRSLTIPSTINEIEDGAFKDYSLTKIYVDSQYAATMTTNGGMYDYAFNIYVKNDLSISGGLIESKYSLKTTGDKYNRYIPKPSTCSGIGYEGETWRTCKIGYDSNTVESWTGDNRRLVIGEKNGSGLYIDNWKQSTFKSSWFGKGFTNAMNINSIYLYDSTELTEIGSHVFYLDNYNGSMQRVIRIPTNITTFSFKCFYNNRSKLIFEYEGTKSQWNSITKATGTDIWLSGSGSGIVYCSDGSMGV